METELANVRISTINKALRIIKNANPTNSDPEVTFEYLIGSLYPNVMNNIREAMTRQYIEGYNKGKADAQNDAT